MRQEGSAARSATRDMRFRPCPSQLTSPPCASVYSGCDRPLCFRRSSGSAEIPTFCRRCPLLLRHLGIPYSGCDAESLAASISKVPPSAGCAAGIPTADWATMHDDLPFFGRLARHRQARVRALLLRHERLVRCARGQRCPRHHAGARQAPGGTGLPRLSSMGASSMSGCWRPAIAARWCCRRSDLV